MTVKRVERDPGPVGLHNLLSGALRSVDEKNAAAKSMGTWPNFTKPQRKPFLARGEPREHGCGEDFRQRATAASRGVIRDLSQRAPRDCLTAHDNDGTRAPAAVMQISAQRKPNSGTDAASRSQESLGEGGPAGVHQAYCLSAGVSARDTAAAAAAVSVAASVAAGAGKQ